MRVCVAVYVVDAVFEEVRVREGVCVGLRERVAVRVVVGLVDGVREGLWVGVRERVAVRVVVGVVEGVRLEDWVGV